MAEDNKPNSAKQARIDELLTVLGERISGQSNEAIAYLYVKKAEFVWAVAEVMEKMVAHEPYASSPPLALPDLIVLPFGYEAPRIIADGEAVNGPIMFERAKKANATSGQKECEDFLTHQSKIDPALRGKAVFVFVDWRHPDYPEDVAIVYWDGDRWVQNWGWLDDVWDSSSRPVRRSTKLQ